MKVTIGAVLLTGLCLAACNPSKDKATEREEPQAAAEKAGAAPAAPAAQVAAEADAYYAQRCVVCHGTEGKGDGPGAAAMEPKPRAYSDAAWQASVTDEDLKKTILGGGMAVGKSPLMPGHPDLKDKPELLDGLVKKIRSFQK